MKEILPTLQHSSTQLKEAVIIADLGGPGAAGQGDLQPRSLPSKQAAFGLTTAWSMQDLHALINTLLGLLLRVNLQSRIVPK